MGRGGLMGRSSSYQLQDLSGVPFKNSRSVRLWGFSKTSRERSIRRFLPRN